MFSAGTDLRKGVRDITVPDALILQALPSGLRPRIQSTRSWGGIHRGDRLQGFGLTLEEAAETAKEGDLWAGSHVLKCSLGSEAPLSSTLVTQNLLPQPSVHASPVYQPREPRSLPFLNWKSGRTMKMTTTTIIPKPTLWLL